MPKLRPKQKLSQLLCLPTPVAASLVRSWEVMVDGRCDQATNHVILHSLGVSNMHWAKGMDKEVS